MPFIHSINNLFFENDKFLFHVLKIKNKTSFLEAKTKTSFCFVQKIKALQKIVFLFRFGIFGNDVRTHDRALPKARPFCRTTLYDWNSLAYLLLGTQVA